MKRVPPALAAACFGLGWSFTAQAQDATPHLTHPADPTEVYRAEKSLDPFAFAVPLLNREVPTPSFGNAAPGGEAASPEAGTMPDINHSKMSGMDHSTMPGMTGN